MRNQEVFAYWKRLGLEYMFLGIEAIDEEGLKAHRKRAPLSANLAALDFARSLGITVAVNIIADPDWDERRFAVDPRMGAQHPRDRERQRQHALPRHREFLAHGGQLTTRDYRLFDIQHAVLPTRLPLDRFYAGAGADPAGPEPEAPRAGRAQGHGRPRGAAAGTRTDQLRPHALALQQRLQPAAPGRRPRAPGRRTDAHLRSDRPRVVGELALRVEDAVEPPEHAHEVGLPAGQQPRRDAPPCP